MMTTDAHLWAIAYDDVDGAGRTRDLISKLGWDPGQAGKYLILLDIVVVVRHPDGSFTLDRKPFSGISNLVGCTAVRFLAGLVVAAPLAGAAVGALVGGLRTVSAVATGIRDDFVREVQGLMKPGTSALFVLDHDNDLNVILHTIRGLGGTVTRTNVDLELARLIQSALASPPDKTQAKVR
jgi:uncharacterized membrane protein